MRTTYRQSGGVSMFLVIFAALLMIVVSVSFVQLTLQEQQQATANDLSQSALDSAQAGVEDAKRLLLLQQSCNNGTVPGGYVAKCPDVTAAINSGQCNTVATIFGDPTKETIVQQSGNDASLQQAYTCVKILPSYVYNGRVERDGSAIIPLKAATDFNTVKISWFTTKDISTGGTTIGFPSVGSDVTLPPLGAQWPGNAPALLRTQFIQTGANFTLSDFDTKQASGESDANTVFLYPLKNSGLKTLGDISNVDARRVASGSPQGIFCNPTFTLSDYACSVSIQLPVYDGSVATRGAFLRLSSLYNSSDFTVELYNNATAVPFDGVQSIIDSTGRANTTFRRVETWVHLGGDFMYPNAALTTTNNICKDFSVTDTAADYDAGSCDPTKPN